ncbi:uncharacterized protein KY384_007793 [Bacidia gigantensis]|uniref:uncharacterized protein n=1 Tax=Bacidia gigantensis TaxID=2732470 RepID=UPI001D04FE14|nr:uncharacterized protein KY384_007793 [Bacidia gigantensis]KAG8527640.1 hypothetical protein KY384_007793 [Bacidia gigantensis]
MSNFFSAPKTATGSTQQTGGLFGSQQNQQPTTNIFGSSTTQQPSGSMFGQPQNQTGSGLFGSKMSNGSIFGSTQSATQNQSSNLQQPPSIFSASIGQQSQAHQTVPGVRISVNELRPTTRFNDLHEELQKTIEYVDAFVLSKIRLQQDCESASDSLERMCQSLAPDVAYCSESLDTVQRALEYDAQSIASVKTVVHTDAADAKLSFKVINNLKLPQQFHHATLWNTVSVPQRTTPSFSDDASEERANRTLVDYFSTQAEELSKGITAYERNVTEVETYLNSVESNALQQIQQLALTRTHNGGEKSAEDQVRELAAVLRDFESGILSVATKVGNSRESAQDAMLGPVNETPRF